MTNWPTYDGSLRQRGSLTVWFTDEAVTAWAVAAWAAEPRTTSGGQPRYSPLDILTALTLRAVFRLAHRQAEGLIGSIVGLLGRGLRVPDHNHVEPACNDSWPPRCPKDMDNAPQAGPLVDQVAGPVASFIADGAYDQTTFTPGRLSAIPKRP